MSQDVGTKEGSDARVYSEQESATGSDRGGVTRRATLAAGGLVLAGSAAGCLDRVAGVVTNTESSPAGAMSGASAGFHRGRGGGGGGRVSLAHDIGNGDVEHVPVTIRAGEGFLSGEVGIDGWLTDDDIVPPANDYNSVRSNKRRSAFVPWDDGDDMDEDTDDDVSEEVEQLYAYLDDKPLIGERFSVCLPDARLPRGGPSVADEVTPRGIVEYLTGDAASCGTDDEGSLYCWGKNERARLSAELHEDDEKRRGVAAFATDGGVCVAGVPADAEGAEEMVALEHCRNGSSHAQKCTVSSSADLGDWGDELTVGDVTISPTFVCPVVAQPDDAPVPFYALLYFTRCRHGEEYIYTGGWLIDDAALHYNSCTLLVAEESPVVVGFTPEDARSGNEDMARRKVRTAMGDVRRRSQGAVVYDGAIDDEALEHMPDALQEGGGLDGLAHLVAVSSISRRSARTGRNPQTGKEIKIPARDGPIASDDEEAMRCVMTALDCPVAHLTDADGMSVDEKAAAYDAFLKIEGIDSEGEPTEA